MKKNIVNIYLGSKNRLATIICKTCLELVSSCPINIAALLLLLPTITTALLLLLPYQCYCPINVNILLVLLPLLFFFNSNLIFYLFLAIFLYSALRGTVFFWYSTKLYLRQQLLVYITKKVLFSKDLTL